MVTYGPETWGIKMDGRHKLGVIEMKYLRNLSCVTRIDSLRKDNRGAELVWESLWVKEWIGRFLNGSDMWNVWVGSGWIKEDTSLRSKLEGIEAEIVRDG